MKFKDWNQCRKTSSQALILVMSALLGACGNSSSDFVSEPLPLELNPTAINFSKEANEVQQLEINTIETAEWEIFTAECDEWLSVDVKKAKGSRTVNLKTKKENNKGQISVTLEVHAADEYGEITKQVLITRDAGISGAKAEHVEDRTIIMSYGMACMVETSDITSYYYHKIYTGEEYTRLSGNDRLIINDAEGNGVGWTRNNVPSNGGALEVVYNNCQPDTYYVFTTVSYDREGNVGEVVAFPFTTKDAKEDNQPRVKVEPYKQTVEEVHDSNNGPWYKWDTNSDGKGTFYITYACASDRIVDTMKGHNNQFGTIDNKIGIDVAWQIFLKSKDDNLESSRYVSFNPNNSSGREKLFGKSRSNATQWLEYRNTDKYLQIVTWAFKDNDFNTYSGVVSDVLYHVNNGELEEVSSSTSTYYVRVSPSSLSFAALPDSYQLSIDSNDSWTISSNSSWCKINGKSTMSGSGKREVTISVTQNESKTLGREAKITIIGENFTTPVTVTVNQTPKVDTIIGMDGYDDDKNLDL